MEENIKPELNSSPSSFSPSCEDPNSCTLTSGKKSGFTGNPEASPIGYPPNAKNRAVYEARKVPPISALGPLTSNGKRRKVWGTNLNEYGKQGWISPPPELVGKGEGKEVKGESKIAAASGGGGGFAPPPKEKKFLFENTMERSYWNGFGGKRKTRRNRKSEKIRKSRKSRNSRK